MRKSERERDDRTWVHVYPVRQCLDMICVCCSLYEVSQIGAEPLMLMRHAACRPARELFIDFACCLSSRLPKKDSAGDCNDSSNDILLQKAMVKELCVVFGRFFRK